MEITIKGGPGFPDTIITPVEKGISIRTTFGDTRGDIFVTYSALPEFAEKIRLLNELAKQPEL